MEENSLRLLEELNESQRKAVEYCDGPSLVIAGAGSGKTRVLTYKIAYLIEKGLAPYHILALTFTNKAAKEMKERITTLVGSKKAYNLRMGTFHSVFSKILRVEAAKINYDSNFTIYDESDSRSLLKTIIKGMGLDEKVYKPATVHGFISIAKNHLITAEAYAGDRAALERDKARRMPEVSKIYIAYNTRCRQANAMDFDDLLLNTYLLFKNHTDVAGKYAEQFQYILVDEYQDTNYVQVAIVQQLAMRHRRVCVVGDDYQSIYSFRGANIDNILDFKKKFENAKLFKLERNYRSTQCIVQAANSLMKHNERQIPKEVYSKEDEGHKIVYKPCYSDKEEAMVVMNELKHLKAQENFAYNDFAILYRTNSQSRSFEDELRRNAIPYRIYGGLSFYQRKEIKDIIAYFRLTVNQHDEEAFRRIINYPARGIGNTTLHKITQCAEENGISLWEVINAPETYGLNVNKGTISKLSDFVSLISGFVRKVPTTDAYELGKEIIKTSGLSAELYANKEPEDLVKQENLEEFLSAMHAFVEANLEEGREDETYLTDFLREVALYSDLDKEDDGAPKVTLMTIHAAKGLEFPIVFIVGVEENIFPSPMSANSKRELEEERRLFYVAITRAKKHCVITNARNRFRYGTMQFDTPSRFLKDIDTKFVELDPMSASLSGYKKMPWDEEPNSADFDPGNNKLRKSLWNNSDANVNIRFQNSKPVASQFKADFKPKITEQRSMEEPINPLSQRTRERLLREGGKFKKLSMIISDQEHGGKIIPETSSVSALKKDVNGGICVGAMIEHQRFGIGKVLQLAGVGENAKATVEFRNAGTKQLLLKFAKYKVL